MNVEILDQEQAARASEQSFAQPISSLVDGPLEIVTFASRAAVYTSATLVAGGMVLAVFVSPVKSHL